LYQKSDGANYSTVKEDNKLVRVEIFAGYVKVCNLLKAIERSLRHQSLGSFISMDRSYYVIPRSTSKVPVGRARTVEVEEERPLLTKPSPTNSGGRFDLHASMASLLEDIGVKDATDRRDTYDPVYPAELDFDEDMLATSSDKEIAWSIVSLTSLASSVTDLSKASGYSPVQIATAIRELLSTFRDDEVLHPLYTTAIHGAVGPREFVEVFRRLLKVFADRLKGRAQHRLDFLAAQIVAFKSQDISDEILAIYRLGKAPELDPEEEEFTVANHADQDSSDEDEQGETKVDRPIFEDTMNIRESVVRSKAFKLLRTDLQHFISSKRQSKKPSSEREDKTQLDERMKQIYKSIIRQIGAHTQPTRPSIENDCSDSIRHDRALLELHLHALEHLGEDQFVIEYADLLRHYFSNAIATLDSKVDDSTRGDTDDQLITIASAIVLHLEIADANALCWRDQSSGTNAFFLGEDLESLEPLDLISTKLAVSTLRRPLRQLLSQIPRSAMNLSDRNDTSWVNTTKAFIEDYTMAEWDWWPLAPRVPGVAPGECRLQWKVRFRLFIKA